VTLVGLVCCFPGASGAADDFFVRAGGQGRPLGALLPIFYNRTHPAIPHAEAAAHSLAQAIILDSQPPVFADIDGHPAHRHVSRVISLSAIMPVHHKSLRAAVAPSPLALSRCGAD